MEEKEVLVLMELRARFDEENNINYSEILEEAGCKVMYGMEDYKVHSKVCLITKKNSRGIYYITQIGKTGNYNESTSKMYTDLSLMTASDKIGQDASIFFHNIRRPLISIELINIYLSHHQVFRMRS